MDSLATLVGPLAAAGLIALGGAEAALAACALASLASALLVTRLRYEQSRRARPLGGGVRQGIEGLRAIAADPELGLLTALGAVQTFLRGCSTVLMVVVAIELLGGGDADVGLLNAAIGAGAIAGSLLASTITWNGRLARCFGVGVVLWGAPLAVLAGLPTEAAALLVFAALGVGNALVDIGVFTLMARLSPDRVMARVFAAFEALITLAVALGAAITPAAIELLGEQGALLALGLIGPVAVAAAWPALRALDRRMVTRDADIDVLRQVAMLQPLPEPTIEHLASGLQREVFEPGTTVFDEGDPGASFYIITAGRAEVTKGPVSIARLGPGECFGEIALLRSDLPRTATIRAAGDAALHVGVIDQGRFVAAVTGFASSAELAEELVAVRLPEAASTQT